MCLRRFVGITMQYKQLICFMAKSVCVRNQGNPSLQGQKHFALYTVCNKQLYYLSYKINCKQGHYKHTTRVKKKLTDLHFQHICFPVASPPEYNYKSEKDTEIKSYRTCRVSCCVCEVKSKMFGSGEKAVK